MKKLVLSLFILLIYVNSYAQSSENKELAIECFSKYIEFVGKFKESNYLIDPYYNKFYRNIERPGQFRYDRNEQIGWSTFFFNTENTQSIAQVDENTGLVFLVRSTSSDIWLKIFHPIIGPMQFIFDDKNGVIMLPSQTKKVRLVSKKSTQNVGYTLRVRKDSGTTELENNWLEHISDLESQYNNLIDYPDDSNLNTFYATRSVVDNKLTKEKEYKYYPSYQEKLRWYYMFDLPKVDLENPNFFILKTDVNEIYKTEVWGRKGERHFLNDCFDGLKSSFGHYFIFKRNDKFGILNASLSDWKQSNPILIENIYDNITPLQGTEYFLAESNGIKTKIDVHGNVIEVP